MSPLEVPSVKAGERPSVLPLREAAASWGPRAGGALTWTFHPEPRVRSRRGLLRAEWPPPWGGPPGTGPPSVELLSAQHAGQILGDRPALEAAVDVRPLGEVATHRLVRVDLEHLGILHLRDAADRVVRVALPLARGHRVEPLVLHRSAVDLEGQQALTSGRVRAEAKLHPRGTRQPSTKTRGWILGKDVLQLLLPERPELTPGDLADLQAVVDREHVPEVRLTDRPGQQRRPEAEAVGQGDL